MTRCSLNKKKYKDLLDKQEMFIGSLLHNKVSQIREFTPLELPYGNESVSNFNIIKNHYKDFTFPFIYHLAALSYIPSFRSSLKKNIYQSEIIKYLEDYIQSRKLNLNLLHTYTRINALKSLNTSKFNTKSINPEKVVKTGLFKLVSRLINQKDILKAGLLLRYNKGNDINLLSNGKIDKELEKAYKAIGKSAYEQKVLGLNEAFIKGYKNYDTAFNPVTNKLSVLGLNDLSDYFYKYYKEYTDFYKSKKIENSTKNYFIKKSGNTKNLLVSNEKNFKEYEIITPGMLNIEDLENKNNNKKFTENTDLKIKKYYECK